MADPFEPDPYELDLDEPVSPKPSAPAPLPRLWKTPPETEVAEDVATARAKKRAKAESEAKPKVEKARPRKKEKKKEEKHDDGTGASKLEETPVLDTYEARQRARWLIGGLLAVIGVTALVLVLRTFKGDGSEEITSGEPPEPRSVVTQPRANPELEARQLVENARKADKVGKTKEALILLHKVADHYQGTAGSREALAAIDRERRQLSLFGSDVPEQSTGPKPPPSGTNVATAPSAPSSGEPKPVPPSPPRTDVGPAPPPAEVVKINPAMPTKTIPAGFHAKPGAPIHASGWPSLLLCDRDGSVMVLVPGGTFLMGREDGEPTERPTHWVAVSTYYIDQHEVTVRQYVQFLKDTGRPIDVSKLAPRETTDPPSTIDDHPVVNISAREAKAYCNWAVKRLPTEAQWEMAARSPDGRISYWNGELPRKDPPRGTRPMEAVMSLPSDVSPYGVFDMGANAWEWTSEYYDTQYYQQFRNLVTDPTGPKEPRTKLVQVTVKGGSKIGILTWRDGMKIETRLPYLGFRGALPVEGAPIAPPKPTTAPAGPSSLPGGVVPL